MNFKINLVGCTFKISVIMLQMEYIIKAYSMLLGRPLLRQAKAYHDWGNNTLTIIVDTITVTLNTKK